MEAGRGSLPRSARIVLLSARVIGGLLIAVVIVTFVAEALGPGRVLPTPVEMLGLAMFPIGVCVGYVVGWKRPLAGGVVSIACLAGFVVWLLVQRDSLRALPALLVFALPAALLVFHGIAWGRRDAAGARALP